MINDKCVDNFLDKISSGKQEWLDVAVALHPYTDAGWSEMLEDSLGEAMQKAPSRVLPLVDSGKSFDKMICMPWIFEGEKPEKIYERQIKNARPMFESFLSTSLKDKALICLKVVEEYEKNNNK